MLLRDRATNETMIDTEILTKVERTATPKKLQKGRTHKRWRTQNFLPLLEGLNTARYKRKYR